MAPGAWRGWAWCHGFPCLRDCQAAIEAQTDDFRDTLSPCWLPGIRSQTARLEPGARRRWPGVMVFVASETPRLVLKPRRTNSVTPCSGFFGLSEGASKFLSRKASCHGFAFLRYSKTVFEDQTAVVRDTPLLAPGARQGGSWGPGVRPASFGGLGLERGGGLVSWFFFARRLPTRGTPNLL